MRRKMVYTGEKHCPEIEWEGIDETFNSENAALTYAEKHGEILDADDDGHYWADL